MSLLQIESPPPTERSWPLLRLGFRPFYLVAATFAMLAVPLWLAALSGWLVPFTGLPGLAWHAHEMLFGYAIAVIAGFLLTAVPNWTGLRTPSGAPLAALVLLWLGARLLLPWAPLLLAAAVDLAFLPILALILQRILSKSGNTRNLFVPRLLLALTGLNLAFYLAQSGILAFDPQQPLLAALALITTLEVIIAGRVVPMFTRNAVPGVRQSRHEWIERHLARLTLLCLLANLLPLPAWLLASANLGLGILHLIRLVGWGAFASRKNPLLWILHGAYLCIALGFLLASAAALGMVPWIAVHHLFGIGALGGLTLGMLTRTALGHSGRMLRAGRCETLAYSAVLLAAAVRIGALTPLANGHYMAWLWTAGLIWSGAFMLYLWRYVPILSRARVDGKPG